MHKKSKHNPEIHTNISDSCKDFDTTQDESM